MVKLLFLLTLLISVASYANCGPRNVDFEAATSTDYQYLGE